MTGRLRRRQPDDTLTDYAFGDDYDTGRLFRAVWWVRGFFRRNGYGDHAAPHRSDPGEFDSYDGPFGDDDTAAYPTVVYPSMLPLGDTHRFPAYSFTPEFDPEPETADFTSWEDRPTRPRPAEWPPVQTGRSGGRELPTGMEVSRPLRTEPPPESDSADDAAWRADGWREVVAWIRDEPAPPDDTPEPAVPEITAPAIPAEVLAILDGKTPDQFLESLFWPLECQVAMLPATYLPAVMVT